MKYDIFISYASEDKDDIAKPLADQLIQDGFKIFFDEFNISPGDSIIRRINEGLKESRIFTIIISTNSFKKIWTNIELGAINIIINKDIQKIIPILYKLDANDLSQKLPFLADIKAIKGDIGIKAISKELKQVFDELKTKSIAIFQNFNELSLNEIGVFLSKNSNDQIKMIGFHILYFLKIAEIDIDMAFIKARKIIEYIIVIIMKIKDDNNIDLINLLRNSSVINKNIFEHISTILRFSDIIINDKEAINSFKQNNIELCKSSLTAILNWCYNIVFIDTLTFSVIPADKITYSVIEESFLIEQESLRPELISPIDEVYNWYQHNNYTMHAIQDNSNAKLAGFITSLPVTDDFFERYSTGEIDDIYINTKDIRKFDFPDFYKIYLSSLCIAHRYRNTIASKILYDSYINTILEFAITKEIYITEILADASTIQGESLCQRVGFQYLNDTKHNTKLYKGTLIPPALRPRNRKGKELMNFYIKKFDELKFL